LRNQLEENEPELVIMGKPPDDIEVDAKAFMSNPLDTVASSEHLLVKETNIALSRFAVEHFAVRETGSGTLGTIERFFAEHDVPFHTV